MSTESELGRSKGKIKMKKILIIICTMFAITSFSYYQAEQGRWLNRDPIGERGGINIYSASKNNPVNRLDPFGLTSDSQCSHTIRVAHLFGSNDGSGNWDHFNSDQNDGSTCYVGCGMNELNRRQGGSFPDTAAGTAPIPPSVIITDPSGLITSDNHGYELVGDNQALIDLTPDSYDGDPSKIGTISGLDIPANIDRKRDEISTLKCALKDDKGCLVCKTVSIQIICPHGQADSRCGTAININCESN